MSRIKHAFPPDGWQVWEVDEQRQCAVARLLVAWAECDDGRIYGVAVDGRSGRPEIVSESDYYFIGYFAKHDYPADNVASEKLRATGKLRRLGEL